MLSGGIRGPSYLATFNTKDWSLIKKVGRHPLACLSFSCVDLAFRLAQVLVGKQPVVELEIRYELPGLCMD